MQDDWRFNNKLTMNLGLHYDIYRPLPRRKPVREL